MPSLNEATDGVLELFRPGMLFEFRIKLGDGESRSDLKLGVTVVDGAVTAAKAATLGEIVNGLVIDVDVRLSKSMLPEGLAEMFLAQPIQTGMIEDRGDYFRGTGELKDSKVSVNGNEFPVMEQMRPFLDSEEGMAGFRQGMKKSFMGGIGADGVGDPAAAGGADMNQDANPGESTPPTTPTPAPEAAPDAQQQ